MSAIIGDPGFTWDEWHEAIRARETAEAIHDGDDGPWNQHPRCPWCANANLDWWDGYGFKNDGDEVELECGDCEKKYVATMCVETTFQSKRVKP